MTSNARSAWTWAATRPRRAAVTLLLAVMLIAVIALEAGADQAANLATLSWITLAAVGLVAGAVYFLARRLLALRRNRRREQ